MKKRLFASLILAAVAAVPGFALAEQAHEPITAVKESASPRCVSLTAMLCCADR